MRNVMRGIAMGVAVGAAIGYAANEMGMVNTRRMKTQARRAAKVMETVVDRMGENA